MSNFYKIFFYSIAFILSPFSTNYITLCLDSRVDIFSITTLSHQYNLYL